MILTTPHSPLPTAVQLALVAASAVVGGMVNSIAGGGTLLTFPALIGLGVPPLVANATSTVALWPAAVASMWGYRDELAGARKWAVGFALPSLAGGIAGAVLLLKTPPDRFSALVPWLVLGATALFAMQRPLQAAVRLHAARKDAAFARRTSDVDAGGGPRAARPAGTADPALAAASAPAPAGAPADRDADARLTRHFPPRSVLAYQLLVAVYGGYFGAGVGILMLAALGFMGLTNIHRMNGLKNWGGLCMNAVAAGLFIASRIVNWPVALVMAAGASLGGYGGSRIAQRLPQQWVRAAITAVGLLAGLWLLAARL